MRCPRLRFLSQSSHFLLKNDFLEDSHHSSLLVCTSKVARCMGAPIVLLCDQVIGAAITIIVEPSEFL